ncbi:MAG: hypothetical protein EB012_11290, partial [Gammaproteobacteria bacterium]|nr:hypothetical protein [Gammaproteobacteria bacterium]
LFEGLASVQDLTVVTMKTFTLTPEPRECKGGRRHSKTWTLSPYGIDEWMGNGLPGPFLLYDR